MHQEEQNQAYKYWRTVLPDNHDIKMQVLRELHCVPYSGHPGYNRTLELAKQNFYWQHMSQDVREFVINCPVHKFGRNWKVDITHAESGKTTPFAWSTF